tara:strand:+ start:230429 stop:231226 length:798 start_codon:yes stop_codon:yes gene_type:complete
MNTLPKCTLVTSTYNWPEALELLLLSTMKQSVLPDEVIVADDGSTEKTRQLIEHFKKIFPVPLHHVWQEDKEFRKAKIMNKAIAKARYDYIVEIDGDIILHPRFVEDHLRFAEKGHYLFGSRVNIQENLLPELFAKKQTTFHFFSKGIKKRSRTLRLPFLMNFAKSTDTISLKLRGCNMSFWRNDFISINGFNESFEGWGNEDSEMIQRLHNSGIKGKRLKFAGIVYHIYHKVKNKNKVKTNREIEKKTTAKKIIFTEEGIDKYL